MNLLQILNAESNADIKIVSIAYAADHVRDCILEGRLESPLITLKETILIAELMETVRKQVGVAYLQD